MAKKISYNEIRNINEDWGYDDRNGKPYSGRSVQDFIKKTFNEKGIIVDGNNETKEELSFVDENGECILQAKNGHIKTKYFDSSTIPTDYIASDNMDTHDDRLSIVDESGECIVQFAGGHIKTKNFDSRNTGSLMQGKTVILLGDSQVNQSRQEFEQTIANLTGATVLKCGFGGCRMSWRTEDGSSVYDAFSMVNVADCLVSGVYDSMEGAFTNLDDTYKTLYRPSLDSLKTITPSVLGDGDGYIITIAYGSNDYGSGASLGNPENMGKTTLLGAMQYAISVILTKYQKLQILFIGLPYRVYEREGTTIISDSDAYTKTIGGVTYHRYDYSDAILENSMKNHLPCFDMYRKCLRTKYNIFTICTDGTHPTTQYGSTLAGELYAKFLLSY